MKIKQYTAKKQQDNLIENLNKTITELEKYHFAIQLGEARNKGHLEKNSKQYKLAEHLNEEEKKALREAEDKLRQVIKIIQHCSHAELLSYDFGDTTEIKNFQNLFNMFNDNKTNDNTPNL